QDFVFELEILDLVDQLPVGRGSKVNQDRLKNRLHVSATAKGSHVAEDVGGVEALLIDVQVEFIDQLHRDVVHELCGQVVVAKEGAIAFESAEGYLVEARFEIESELDIGVKEIGLDRVVVGPAFGFL